MDYQLFGSLVALVLALQVGTLSGCQKQDSATHGSPEATTLAGGTSLDEVQSSEATYDESQSLCELLSNSSGVGVYMVESITSKIEKDETYTVADGQMRPKLYVHFVSGEELVKSAPEEFMARADGGVNKSGSITLPPFGVKVGEKVVVFLPQELEKDGYVEKLYTERLFRDRGDGGYTNESIFGVEKHTLDDLTLAISYAVGSGNGECVDVLPDSEMTNLAPSESEPEESPHEVQGVPSEE